MLFSNAISQKNSGDCCFFEESQHLKKQEVKFNQNKLEDFGLKLRLDAPVCFSGTPPVP